MDEVKQVIVIRKDLKMSLGKCCAQTAHAAMKIILDKASIVEDSEILSEKCVWQLQVNKKEPIYSWLKGSFTKIIVGVNSLKELEDLEFLVIENNILVAKVTDEGRTEFKGIPTITALSIGPDWSTKIDPLTKHLKLI